MASPALTVLAARGNACHVEFVIRQSGSCPAKDFFLDDCEKIHEGGKLNPKPTAKAKFAHLFQQMADCGRLQEKRFKKEMGVFFAFRLEVRNLQIRFACFQDGKNWIVTHGFIKPGAKNGLGDWPASDVKRAVEIRGEYLLRKQASKRPGWQK